MPIYPPSYGYGNYYRSYSNQDDPYYYNYNYLYTYPAPSLSNFYGVGLGSLATATNTKETTPVATKKYIIIGTSGAATFPTEHASVFAAENEANRLAKNKPGEEFTIYESKKSYKVEQPQPVVKTFV